MSELAALEGTSGRSRSLVLRGLSAAGRAVPVSLLMALPGLVYLAGFDHLAFGLGLLAGIVLAGLLIAPLMSRSGAETITDALGRRFGRLAAVFGGIVIVLVVLPLLAADFAMTGLVAESGLGLSYLGWILAALMASSVVAVALGERSFRALSAIAYVLLAASVVAPLALMAAKSTGGIAPQVAYGPALTAIGGLEETLLENGLVDFETFSVHVTPFLRLSQLDMIALVVSLALGTAVLPQLLTALATERRPGATRIAGAWTAFFVMIILVAMPALAAFAKLEIYGAIAKGTPLAALPAWLEAPLRANLAQIHGTSVAMLEQVAQAVGAGAADPAAVADHLASLSLTVEERWHALDDGIKLAVIEAARSLPAEASSEQIWQTYTTSMLPAVAAAAGNDAAVLSQAALVFEPAGLLLALPELSGAPRLVAPGIAVGVIAAGIVMVAALARSLMSLGGGRGKDVRTWSAVILALAVTALAAGFAALQPGELVTIVVSSLSLGAAGLFPVLALGLSWKRATAAGAVAAIVVGAGVTLYYDIGIQVFPAAFYKTWQGLSDAGEMAIEEFKTREEALNAAEGDEAKADARVALDDWARGTNERPGLANWAGVKSAVGAIFGVPLGLLALVVVSLLSGLRRARSSEKS